VVGEIFYGGGLPPIALGITPGGGALER